MYRKARQAREPPPPAVTWCNVNAGASVRAFWRSQREPVDAASLVFFRIAFGLLLLVATIRFAAYGWIREHYLEPRWFFPFWGLGFLKPLPAPAMYGAFALMGLASLGVALGAFYRASALVLGLVFTYVHAIDKTYYLNHYYLVSVLCFLLALLPLNRSFAIDARIRGSGSDELPRWVLSIVRFQIAVVYFFGGVAKLGSDWLVHAQPLTIWLSRNRDVFLIGPLLGYKATAYAMSWCGLLFDLSTPFLLSWRRTRVFAYGGVLLFHLITARLFQLGMFPYFMSAFALIFFPPDFPRRVFVRWPAKRSGEQRESKGVPRWLLPYVAFQILFPFRALLYPGSALWTEEGYRFSWNVMLSEKNAYVEVTAVDRVTGERFDVAPLEYLTPQQAKQMSAQPDMILQFAHIVHDDFAARGRDVGVFVNAGASLNARPSAPLVDPTVDLAAERDSWLPKRWIRPLPSGLEPRF
jgi:vitamin K-dependent gamma-carboxylase